MLLALSKEQKSSSICVEGDRVVDQNGRAYVLEGHRQEGSLEGTVEEFSYQLKDGRLTLQITCLSGQRVELKINLSKLLMDKKERQLYQKLVKRLKKQQKSENKLRKYLDREDEEAKSEQAQAPLTQNELTYLEILEQLQRGISKKYVIEYFKKQNDNRIVDFIFPKNLVIERELLNI